MVQRRADCWIVTLESIMTCSLAWRGAAYAIVRAEKNSASCFQFESPHADAIVISRQGIDACHAMLGAGLSLRWSFSQDLRRWRFAKSPGPFGRRWTMRRTRTSALLSPRVGLVQSIQRTGSRRIPLRRCGPVRGRAAASSLAASVQVPTGALVLSQHSGTLTARPPRLVSLNLTLISSPVWRIARMQLSRGM